MKSKQQSTAMYSAKVVLTELLREPVKDAVREAIREERYDESAANRPVGIAETGRSGDGSSRFAKLLLWGGITVGVAMGLAYLRRQRSSTASQQSPHQTDTPTTP